MTSVQQLAAARVLLDEATADFFLDAKIYASLAEAQNAAIVMLIAAYRAKGKDALITFELATILEVKTSSAVAASFVATPAGFLHLVRATYDHDASGGEEPCTIVSQNSMKDHREGNTYLAAVSTFPVAYVDNLSGTTRVSFLPVFSTNHDSTFDYFKKPTDIASGQDPTLPETTHDAMVFYAVAKHFEQDDESQKSQYWMGLFNQEIGKVV